MIMIQPTRAEKFEFLICGIINGISTTLLAAMVATTVLGWLALLTVLTPAAPEITRIHAARVTWAYIEAGDALRKEFHHE